MPINKKTDETGTSEYWRCTKCDYGVVEGVGAKLNEKETCPKCKNVLRLADWLLCPLCKEKAGNCTGGICRPCYELEHSMKVSPSRTSKILEKIIKEGGH